MMRGAMLLGVAMALSTPGAQAGDALPSWRDGPAKQAILDFVRAVVGAGFIGLLVGLLTVRLRQRLDDPVLNTTISFAVPFLAYFPAEQAGASGVLAVVTAGLVTGARKPRRASSANASGCVLARRIAAVVS